MPKEKNREELVVRTNSEVLTGIIIDGRYDSVSYVCFDDGVSFTLRAGKDVTPQELKIWIESYLPQAKEDADFDRYVKSYATGEEKTHEAALENIGTAPSAEEESLRGTDCDAEAQRAVHDRNIRRAKRTLQKIPKAQRIIIQERYMKEKPSPYRQIAPIIGKSEATVRRWEKKAMTALRGQMPKMSEQEILCSLRFIYRDED